MSFFSKLSNRLGIARFSVETPTSQKQKTPSIPSTAVRPLDGPKRRHAGAGATLPPRAAVPSALAASAAAANVGAPSSTGGAASNQPSHVLIDLMGQASPDCAVLTKELFTRSPVLFAAADLAIELRDLDLSRMPPIPGLPGAPTVLLAQALAAATGGDARLARAALEELQGLDPQQDIVTAWRQRAGGPEDDASVDGESVYHTPRTSAYYTPDGSVEGDQDRSPPASPRRSMEGGPSDASVAARRAAWQVAAALAGTPTGMDVLQAVVARPVDAAHREDFALLLKAATGMPARHAERGDPAAILASSAALGTLTGEAVACTAARMAGEVDAARLHQGSMTSARNDLFERGPGTEFAALNARLMKTGRWIERATPERGRLLRNPIFGKSPFRALRHGTQNVERGPAIARHRAAREAALREAAVALKEQLIAMAPFTRSPGSGQVSDGLLRAAVLAHCLETPAPRPLERAGFDADACADIADRLANLLTPAPAPGLQRQLAQMPQLKALTDLRLDAKLMGEWLAAARTAEGGPALPGAREAGRGKGCKGRRKCPGCRPSPPRWPGPRKRPSAATPGCRWSRARPCVRP
ncbi:hypothetical protein [Acidovorax sp. NCPPB 3576]|uniref:hypothetical protein n=1 Tax=Acidovorax sp. NCPPB 3576 TaxID=2940488 RepID=UPI00234BF45A|nr:hypothetical protein [Acidovorax sp. NCPPB 3576]